MLYLDVNEYEGRVYVRGSCYIQDPYGGDGWDEEAVICLKCQASARWYTSIKHDKFCHPRKTKKPPNKKRVKR